MLKNQSYEPNQLPSIINNPSVIHSFFSSNCTYERSLLVSVLQMLLGCPSTIFPFKNSAFNVNPKMPQLPHIDRTLLLKELDQLTLISNKMSLLRRSVHEISLLPNRVLHAFAIGLHQIQREIEASFCQKLLVVRQEQGNVYRNQKDLESSQVHPTCLLGMTKKLKGQSTILSLAEEIISYLPRSQPINNEDLNRSAIFLLNFYFQQCQQEYLTGRPYLLHAAFQLSLKAYLEICQVWLSFNEPAVQSIGQTGFFIDLNQAVSLSGERFFNINKIMQKQLVPILLHPYCREIVQIGKTVQFIKFYLSEEELIIFHQYLNVQSEFALISQFLSKVLPPSTFTNNSSRITNATISGRCNKKNIYNQKKLTQTDEDPFSVSSSSSEFISLRQNKQLLRAYRVQQPLQQSLSQIQTRTKAQNLNIFFKKLLYSAYESLAMKCKLMMKQHKIKNSIFQTLKGIKKFVLLTQGDFVQEFLEHSKPLLQKPSDKISPNNLQNIIEEAAKSSSCHPFFLEIREYLSFVFLLGKQSGLKGWRSFSFTVKSKPPVSFIFHGESMSDYENIGNLLFNLRRCQHALVNYWRKTLLAGSSSLQQLRSAVHLFVTSLQTYLFQEIQDLWQELMIIFESCKSVLQLLQANNELVAKLKRVTIQDKSLSNSLIWLVKIVEQLETVLTRLQEGQIEGINTDIQQIWSWFLSLLDQARQIDRLADRLNFDFDYVTHIHNS